MSSEVFPVFPGLVFEDREPFYETETFASPSGYEQRVSNMATKRWRWRARGTLRQETPAPAPWMPYSELGALQWFFDRHKGSGESFLFDDPTNQKNLLAYSQDFSQSIWTKTGGGTGVAPVATPNATVAPDGTTTADQVVFNVGAGTTTDDLSILAEGQTDLAIAAATYAHCFWVKGTPGDTIMARGVAGSSYQTVGVTGSWQRLEWTESASTTAAILQIGLRRGLGITVPNTASVMLWGTQIGPGSSATLYVPTGASPETGRYRVRFSDDRTPMRRVTDQWYAADFELVSVLGET